jgi:hypothetical protein
MYTDRIQADVFCEWLKPVPRRPAEAGWDAAVMPAAAS